jgi:hypothetical protein
VAGSPYSGSIICSSKGVINQSISTASSNVTPQDLKITANDIRKKYGDVLIAEKNSKSFSSTGLQNGESIEGMNIVYESGAAASDTVAIYSGSVKANAASGGTFAAGNYNITYHPGNIIVEPVDLQITAKSQTKVYSAVDPDLTFETTGFVNNDNNSILTGKLARDTGESAGKYPIKIGTLKANANYTIQYTGNNLTITPAGQVISWTQTLSTGCNGEAQIILTATSSSGLPINYSITNVNIATVKDSILTLVNPGITTVTASQNGNDNYLPASIISDTLNFLSANLISAHWNDVIIFNNSGHNYVTWQWYKNNSIVSGSSDQYYTENNNTLNGQYYVIATDNSNNAVQTCPLTLNPTIPISGGITVYPNPALAGTTIKIIANYNDSQLQGSTLITTSINGTLLSQLSTVHPTNTMTAPITPGIYIITLKWNNGKVASTNLLVK